MIVEDIEKIVHLIENTKDDAVKSLLRKLLEQEVAKNGAIASPGLKIAPYTAPFTTTKPTCRTCGLVLDGVMSYSCPHSDCPTGLGPTFSGKITS